MKKCNRYMILILLETESAFTEILPVKSVNVKTGM